MTVLNPVDFILNIDEHLLEIIATYGAATYAILFAIVFCETGLVVTPLLPGDSLLFAAGAFAAQGKLNVWVVYLLLFAAAVAGDNSNYWIGRTIGAKWMAKGGGRIFKAEYLDRTREFFHRHGGKAIIMARFVPIVRTFAPFVAGLGHMRYPRFLAFSLGGGLAWIGGFVTLGYFFGAIPAVEENFTLAILAIIALSIVPGVWHWAKDRMAAKRGLPVHPEGAPDEPLNFD
ncbi:MAG: DedA family protein [Actinobacteria bacterium]|nr:MAG: DedA family protein [Actinomycetota bacterium]